MSIATLRLDIVSVEKQIFSGDVELVFVTGEMGELGIAPGHSQLLTNLRPGFVKAILPNKSEEVFYISGGMLEIQPYIVTVLADTAERADTIDEAAALEAKEHAEKTLAGKASDLDFVRATAELADAIARLRTLQRIRKHVK